LISLNLVQRIAVSCSLAVPLAFPQSVPGVTYVDQPKGIDLATLIRMWPNLQIYAGLLARGEGTEVRKSLETRAAARSASIGEFNLLAQLEWQHGDLEQADAAIAHALARGPNNPLNTFQQAMVNFAHLRRATNVFDRWIWQRRTREAYARTFALDPKNVSARYYLIYSYLNTPPLLGGDKGKALELAEGGIVLGQKEFYSVRADVHRERGERQAAAADYDTAISLKVIKLGGLVDAAQQAIGLGEMDRAKKYLEFAIYCRSDASSPFEALGDYYVRLNNKTEAAKYYQLALLKDPGFNKYPEKPICKAEKLRSLQK